MLRLLQLQHESSRRIALVDEPNLRLLGECSSIYELACHAIEKQTSLAQSIEKASTDETLDYDEVYSGRSPWKILLPIDHPTEPARCMVSGTGLTHLGSAADRNKMHAVDEAELTDSMKMFRAGVEAGRPESGKVGVAPEWFYKGTGENLRAHGEPLDVPPYALDGGEEAEIAGVYVIGPDGAPYRVGMAAGNEFSDHKFEKTNYLNLAGSKIRTCSLGPELVIGPDFADVSGKVTLHRGEKHIWSCDIRTGERNMCHSLANIEHHHFKHVGHRRPGDLHIHYFGAFSLSFGAGVQLTGGDQMQIQFAGFGRPLVNTLRVIDESERLVEVRGL